MCEPDFTFKVALRRPKIVMSHVLVMVGLPVAGMRQLASEKVSVEVPDTVNPPVVVHPPNDFTRVLSAVVPHELKLTDEQVSAMGDGPSSI